MVTTESGGLMKPYFKSVTPSSQNSPEMAVFTGCKCPRTLSLIREIFAPEEPNYLHFREHLLYSVADEILTGHINNAQAKTLYARVLACHKANLQKCNLRQEMSTGIDAVTLQLHLNSRFNRVNQDLNTVFDPLIDGSRKIKISTQPLCDEFDDNKFFGLS
jgi:hypothetical protein